MLEHARAVALAITGVGTAYFGPLWVFKAVAQIALGASGTPGAQVLFYNTNRALLLH